MARARAAPRASSRSRHSFPVAECDTPRKAGGASTGNADAGSVMMLAADRQAGPQFNDSHDAGASYTRHPRVTASVIAGGASPLGRASKDDSPHLWPILARPLGERNCAHPWMTEG